MATTSSPPSTSTSTFPPPKRKLSFPLPSFNHTPRALLLLLTLALLLISPVDALLNLRCCIITEHPFIYKDARRRYIGAAMEYYHSLANLNTSRHSVRLNCVQTTNVPGPQSFVPFLGFSNLVDHFDKCARRTPGSPHIDTSSCECDIGTISAARNTERNSKVDFVAPAFFDSIAIVQRTSTLSTGGNTLFFLKPFSMSVWFGLAALIFLHIFITLFDRNFAPPSRTDAPPPSLTGLPRLRHALLKSALLRRARYAFFATAFGMVGHSNESADAPGKVRPTTRQRSLALLAIVLGTFLLLAYESGLVLQLFLGEPLSAFRDVNDLKNCRLQASKVCVPAGGNLAQFWAASIAPERKMAKCTDLSPTWIYGQGDDDPYSVGLANVATEGGACHYFMASKATVETAEKTDYCGKLSLVGKHFSPNALGYILPKNSSYTAPLSAATLDLQRSDSIKDPVSLAVTSPCVARTEAQLTWVQLGPFFYVAYVFLGIMMLFMCGGNLLALKTKRVRDFTDADVGGEVDVELGCREKKVKRKWRGTSSSAKGRRRSGRRKRDVVVDADGQFADDAPPSNSTSDREGANMTDPSAVGSAATVDGNAGG